MIKLTLCIVAAAVIGVILYDVMFAAFEGERKETIFTAGTVAGVSFMVILEIILRLGGIG